MPFAKLASFVRYLASTDPTTRAFLAWGVESEAEDPLGDLDLRLRLPRGMAPPPEEATPPHAQRGVILTRFWVLAPKNYQILTSPLGLRRPTAGARRSMSSASGILSALFRACNSIEAGSLPIDARIAAAQHTAQAVVGMALEGGSPPAKDILDAVLRELTLCVGAEGKAATKPLAGCKNNTVPSNASPMYPLVLLNAAITVLIYVDAKHTTTVAPALAASSARVLARLTPRILTARPGPRADAMASALVRAAALRSCSVISSVLTRGVFAILQSLLAGNDDVAVSEMATEKIRLIRLNFQSVCDLALRLFRGAPVPDGPAWAARIRRVSANALRRADLNADILKSAIQTLLPGFSSDPASAAEVLVEIGAQWKQRAGAAKGAQKHTTTRGIRIAMSGRGRKGRKGGVLARGWACLDVTCRLYPRLDAAGRRACDAWVLDMCRVGLMGSQSVQKRATFLLRVRASTFAREGVAPSTNDYTPAQWSYFLSLYETLDETAIHLVSAIWCTERTWALLRAPGMEVWAQLLIVKAFAHGSTGIRIACAHALFESCFGPDVRAAEKIISKSAAGGGGDDAKGGSEPRPGNALLRVISPSLMCDLIVSLLDDQLLYSTQSETKTSLLKSTCALVCARVTLETNDIARANLWARLARSVGSMVSRRTAFPVLVDVLRRLPRCAALSPRRMVSADEGGASALTACLALFANARRVGDIRIKPLVFDAVLGTCIRQVPLDADTGPATARVVLDMLGRVPPDRLSRGAPAFRELSENKVVVAWAEATAPAVVARLLGGGSGTESQGPDGFDKLGSSAVAEYALCVATICRLLRADGPAEASIIAVLRESAERAYGYPYARETCVLSTLVLVDDIIRDPGIRGDYSRRARLMAAGRGVWRGKVLSRCVDVLRPLDARVVAASRGAQPVEESLLKSNTARTVATRLLVALGSGDPPGIPGARESVVELCNAGLAVLAAKGSGRPAVGEYSSALAAITAALRAGLPSAPTSGTYAKTASILTPNRILRAIMDAWDAAEQRKREGVSSANWAAISLTLETVSKNKGTVEAGLANRVWDAAAGVLEWGGVLDTTLYIYSAMRGLIGALCRGGQAPKRVCQGLPRVWFAYDESVQRDAATTRALVSFVLDPRLFGIESLHRDSDGAVLRRCVEDLIDMVLSPGKSTGVLPAILFPVLCDRLARAPTIAELYVPRIARLLTAYEKTPIVPPGLTRTLQTIEHAHQVHFLPKPVESIIFSKRAGEGRTRDQAQTHGVSGTALCRATMLLALDAAADAQSPGFPAFLRRLLKHLLNLARSESFVPDPGKLAFSDSKASVRVGYLWTAISALSRHIGALNESSSGGAVPVDVTAGDASGKDVKRQVSSGRGFIRGLMNDAWLSLGGIQQPSVRHLNEVFISSALLAEPNLIRSELVPRLCDCKANRPTLAASYVTISLHVARSLPESRRDALLEPLWPALVPHIGSNYGIVRVVAQYIMARFAPAALAKGAVAWAGTALASTHNTLCSNRDYKKIFAKMDAYFTRFRADLERSVDGTLRLAASMSSRNAVLPVSVVDSLRTQVRAALTSLRRNYDDNGWLESDAKQPAAEPNQRDSATEARRNNFQQKIRPLSELFDSALELRGQAGGDGSDAGAVQGRRRRRDLIMIASLVSKPANLGGLTRTCEIFNARKLVVPDLKVRTNSTYKALCVTADKWMPLEAVPPARLATYLAKLKTQGYRVLALEQAANSERLDSYTFPEKVAVLLGAEKRGVPVELLNLVDDCVEIPQDGVIRSLNVHVSASLLVWEYTRQRLVAGATADVSNN